MLRIQYEFRIICTCISYTKNECSNMQMDLYKKNFKSEFFYNSANKHA